MKVVIFCGMEILFWNKFIKSCTKDSFLAKKFRKQIFSLTICKELPVLKISTAVQTSFCVSFVIFFLFIRTA